MRLRLVATFALLSGCTAEFLVGDTDDTGSAEDTTSTSGIVPSTSSPTPSSDTVASTSSATPPTSSSTMPVTATEGDTSSTSESVTAEGSTTSTTREPTTETTTGPLPCEELNEDMCFRDKECLWFEGACMESPCLMPECPDLEMEACIDAPSCIWAGDGPIGDCFEEFCAPCGELATQEVCDMAPLCEWNEIEGNCFD